MLRQMLLVLVALALFGAIVVGALVHRNGRSQPAFSLGQLEGVETAVSSQPTSQLARLTTPRAVPFPPGSLDHSFFPLSGGHQPPDCADCHMTGDYQGTNPACQACHAEDDPHKGQYGLVCADCHIVESWQHATFDHSLATGQDCAACHVPPPGHFPGACHDCHADTTDFRVIASFNHDVVGHADCTTCHTPPTHHFPGQCSVCHTTTTWAGASFNHTFPIYHEGANGECATCHPGGETAVYTCAVCHSAERMEKKHDDVRGFSETGCVQCHADGREPDDDD